MSTSYVLLAALMGAVTYPARAIPLLVPQMRSLPPVLLTYVRLVGPAVLASLAAVNLAVRPTDAGGSEFYIGPEWLAVGLCIFIVAWRRNLLLGLVLAAGLMAILRAFGVAPV